ncbi:GTP-binding protein [Flavobacteriaceae bacterium S356]|uniref:GTP-binding protein n=1 Tax=Asprobacillus argus TaxID=3076534 RepID=A0ABU3LB74_9FLAO|nr:GTP-binding protein [Flavobacteriaceae bacterium S356]
MKEEINSEIFLRPRFSIDVEENEIILLERIQNEFKKAAKEYKAKVVDSHIFIDVPEKDAHFWSPQLHIEVVEKTTSSSTVKGLFGPKPQVWTLFMFLHFIVGGAFITFISMLYIKYSLGESLVFPIVMTITLPIVWTLLYVLGRLGRATGKKQMRDLHRLLMDAISSEN